jgi:hypothetical protein
MNTGKSKISPHRAARLRFANDRLIVLFKDGREVHLPLRLYPTLLAATKKQREAWQKIGPGKAFHWKDLDLDLSIEGLIQGLREMIPQPPAPNARRIA